MGISNEPPCSRTAKSKPSSSSTSPHPLFGLLWMNFNPVSKAERGRIEMYSWLRFERRGSLISSLQDFDTSLLLLLLFRPKFVVILPYEWALLFLPLQYANRTSAACIAGRLCDGIGGIGGGGKDIAGREDPKRSISYSLLTRKSRVSNGNNLAAYVLSPHFAFTQTCPCPDCRTNKQQCCNVCVVRPLFTQTHTRAH